MNISYLIQVLQNKITILNNAKSQAFSVGDIEQVNQIDKELLETQNTFNQLASLVDMAQAAATVNSTPADLVATGLAAVQNQIQGPSAVAIVNGYDISAYATDVLHEQKIQTIVNNIPFFTTVAEIDVYIQNIAPGSPVTGEMSYGAARLHSVDLPLLLAIMQNDSSFGTLGIGARTNNPGNVGNTGFAERSYPTWNDGVVAVAEWLSWHRVSGVVHPLVPNLEIPVIIEPVPEPEPEPIEPPKDEIVPPKDTTVPPKDTGIPPKYIDPPLPIDIPLDIPAEEAILIHEEAVEATVQEAVPVQVRPAQETVSMDGVRKMKKSQIVRRDIGMKGRRV